MQSFRGWGGGNFKGPAAQQRVHAHHDSNPTCMLRLVASDSTTCWFLWESSASRPDTSCGWTARTQSQVCMYFVMISWNGRNTHCKRQSRQVACL
jgi:hypothetical protein